MKRNRSNLLDDFDRAYRGDSPDPRLRAGAMKRCNEKM